MQKTDSELHSVQNYHLGEHVFLADFIVYYIHSLSLFLNG
jgi:hypothetical protein